MDVAEHSVANIAAAIGEPARARMLYSLLDGRARTSTELAVASAVSPSTASVHLQRLQSLRLVQVLPQGKHRYYSLQGPSVAAALEALSVLAGASRQEFVPSTPNHLRMARTCYDHIAGTLGVLIYDRLTAIKWLSVDSREAFRLTLNGERSLGALGLDVDALRRLRRRFAYACVDWSERRPHLGGALAAALLQLALKKKWLTQELDSRVLRVTSYGHRELQSRLGLRL